MSSASTTVPFSREAEESVVGAMLARPKIIGEVVGSMLQAEHFHMAPHRVLFDTMVDAYFTDQPIDALSIATAAGQALRDSWGEDVTERCRELAGRATPHEAVAHATLIKRDFDRRLLLEIGRDLQAHVLANAKAPDVLAANASQRAMEVATSRLLARDILDFATLGRNFIKYQKELIAAREEGIELGVKFGMRFLDDYLRGLKATELFILAGEPGVGKSWVAWLAALAFAERQMKKPADKRMGTFVLSLEMAEEPSSARLAQSLSGVDGGRMREGDVTNDELARIIELWGGRKDIPMYFNFTSMLRASQLRALVIEAINRYNIGLVVIDHMRYFDADNRFDNRADEDEEKARFLKESIAKDLDVAVICLAHTTKGIEATDDRRPRLSHLRGSGQVAAHADFVAFAYQPYLHASDADIEEGKVARTDAELIWAKNRHGLTGTANFHFDPSRGYARDHI